MHPTLQPWALSLTYIFLLLGGCSGVSPLAYRSYLANNPRWDEYHLGNRILNASFEAIENGKPLAWEGSCKLSSKSAQSGEYSLLLSAESDKKASICRSARIPITPGHYDASVWLKMRDLQLGAERALSNVLQIRLRHYDDRGQLIAEHHADRENKLPPSLMTSAFRGITSNAVAEHEDFLWTHLRADHYPYDYGWIPPETASVALEISFTGPGKVWLDDFSLMYTKWNFPLAERLAKLGKLPKLALFPTPQQVQQVGKERFLSPLDTKICIASKADPRKLHLESHGLNALYEYLTSSDLFVGAARSCPADSFVMLLDLSLASQYSLSLSPHERKVLRKHAEGYVIKPLEGGRGVALLSSQIRGMEYGLLMLRQLFSNNSTGGVDFVPVHIVDYPSIAIRAMTAKDVHHTQYANVFTADHWLPEARLNGFYFELDLHDLSLIHI